MKENKFDNRSAIYYLLLDKWRRHNGAKLTATVPLDKLPEPTRTERRSSITTGKGSSDGRRCQNRHENLRYGTLWHGELGYGEGRWDVVGKDKSMEWYGEVEYGEGKWDVVFQDREFCHL